MTAGQILEIRRSVALAYREADEDGRYWALLTWRLA